MIGRWLVLIILWVALWGEVSLVNIATGFIVAVILSLLFPGSRRSKHKIRIVPATMFFFYMLRSIIIASWAVILAVLSPNENRRHAEIIRIKLESTSTLIRAVVANTISLTPGTVIVSVDPETSVMDIHVLGKIDPERFRNQINKHEQRVMAFIEEKK
jgi:multicomponent Na+:H+ antiporter subunit E